MSLFRPYSFRIAVAGLLVLVLHIGNAAAQTGTWTTPSSGYVYDSGNRAVRPVTGMIGAALLGAPVASGIDWLSVAPNQTWALAQIGGSQVWIPNLSASGATQALNRIPLVQQAFWSADASQSAILTAGAQLVWLTGFNSSPVRLSSWNLESYSLSGSANAEIVRTRSPRRQTVWTLLAADSSANQVLMAQHTGEVWQLWLASSTVPPVNIPFQGRPVAAAFAPGNGSVFVADAAGQQIVQIRNLQTTPVLTPVVSSAVYVNDPVAMVLSSDGNRLFLADRSGSVIRVFDVSGNAAGATAPMAELPTGTAPGSLTLFAPDRFLINAGAVAGQPVFFLDTGVSPGVSFVPRVQ